MIRVGRALVRSRREDERPAPRASFSGLFDGSTVPELAFGVPYVPSRLRIAVLPLIFSVVAACDAPPSPRLVPRTGVPPTFADVHYGPDSRQVLDFWKAESPSPTPAVVVIHGGAWQIGDKSSIPGGHLERLLAGGISVAAINYRFVSAAEEAGVKPPVRWPLEDAARSIQYLRWRAEEWNIDRARIAATGDSAGGTAALWLAMHDDLADPDADDPVLRESTRLKCASGISAQTTLDPAELRRAIPNFNYGGHAFGFSRLGRSADEEFQAFLDHRDDVLAAIRACSPIEHATAEDPPIFLDYPNQSSPPRIGSKQVDPTHSAVLGLLLKERLEAVGVEVHLAYPGRPDPDYHDWTDFLVDRLGRN